MDGDGQSGAGMGVPRKQFSRARGARRPGMRWTVGLRVVRLLCVWTGLRDEGAGRWPGYSWPAAAKALRQSVWRNALTQTPER